MHAGTISVPGIHTGAACAVVVVVLGVVISVDIKFLSLVIFLLRSGGILRVINAILPVSAGSMNGMPTITRELHMIFQNARVHHTDLNTLTIVTKSISTRRFLSSEAPVSCIFVSFPGLFCGFNLR